MTTKYFALLTSQGAAKFANAAALGTKVQITEMALGDGGGALPTPDAAQTKLIGEKRRASLNSLTVDAANSSQIIAEQIIPESEGGFWIREIGLFDADGVMIAVANCAETYKPQLQEGSGRTQTVRMILIVNSTTAVTLKIDPSVVLATRKYVDDAVIEVKAYADKLMSNHEKAANPHSQYLKIASALSEIKDAGLVADVLKNLGLGDAKYVTSRGSNVNGAWSIWSDGAIDISGHNPSITGGLATVVFPISLPRVVRYISIAERLSTDAGASVQRLHTSMILDDTVTTTGFKARCQMASGEQSSNGFSWQLYCPPN